MAGGGPRVRPVSTLMVLQKVYFKLPSNQVREF